MGNSDGGFSNRKGSFEGILGLGGILAVPEGYKPNNNLAMSDGFKLANHSISSPIAKGEYHVSTLIYCKLNF